MSGLGVITSRTSVSPKSRIDCSSCRFPCSISPGSPPFPAPAGSAAPLSAAGSRGPPPWAAARSLLARVSRPARADVADASGAPITVNDGSSISSTRSGSRWTMRNGSRNSQTPLNNATASVSDADGRRPLDPDDPGEQRHRQRRDDDEQRAGRHEQQDRIFQVQVEIDTAGAALAEQPQRQPHQRGERGLDGPDVDRGAPPAETASTES